MKVLLSRLVHLSLQLAVYHIFRCRPAPAAAAPEDTDRYNALRDLLKSRDAALRSKMRAVTGSGPQAIDPKDDVL